MFELTYVSLVTQNPLTETNTFVKEFFPDSEINNLTTRTKIRLGSTNSLPERIKTGINLFSVWVWEIETANPDFLNNMSSQEFTPEQLLFRRFISNIQLALNPNNDYSDKLSNLLTNIAIGKTSTDGDYIVNSLDPPDEEIAQLIQEVLLNQLPIIIDFPL